ncbi:phage tail assembly chaperone [Erythrobacter dokdonensis]|uniref:phage tail assembly chaperone n=1 Tax=Erythrobacter dokdonensis TaxID=328225 RepID=UPI001E53FB7F|nr:phage tail assembly chaperone [Erythrobacter dokdonensis]
MSARLLGWRPAEFWSATPGELVMALTDSGDSPFPAAPSQEAIARMMERDSDG